MITLRPATERGHFDHGWLDTRHTFSFADYYDPQHMGFSILRVINEDRVIPGAGFPTHAHRDMEIVTYVLEGGLEHRDSMGNGSIIRPGEVQRMTAGTGVTHSEYNASKTDPVHFLQIWILPERRGLAPGYEQRAVPSPDAASGLIRVASRDGAGAVTIHADASIDVAQLDVGRTARHTLRPGRVAWVHVARGAMTLNGTRLGSGDGAAVTDEASIALAASEAAEVLIFDLPAA